MRYRWLVGILLLAGMASAQNTKSAAPEDKGLYGVVSYTTSHDSSLGWTAESDYSVGYESSAKFSTDMGIPVWLVATTESTSNSGATLQKTKTNVLGDLFLRFNFDPKFESFGYRTSLTGTAPTGNTNLGVSTGRGGLAWNNHFEKDFDKLTPFGEFGLSSQQGASKHFVRSYTVLGKSADFRGGADIDLTHHFSAEASFYDVAPFGTQKLYSRVVPRKAAAAASNKKGRPYASQALTVGSSSLAADHGFGAGLSFDPRKRVSIGFDYNHSIVQSLDTVGFNISYRFGHVAADKPAHY
jgi:hypothetical protein